MPPKKKGADEKTAAKDSGKAAKVEEKKIAGKSSDAKLATGKGKSKAGKAAQKIVLPDDTQPAEAAPEATDLAPAIQSEQKELEADALAAYQTAALKGDDEQAAEVEEEEEEEDDTEQEENADTEQLTAGDDSRATQADSTERDSTAPPAETTELQSQAGEEHAEAEEPLASTQQVIVGEVLPESSAALDAQTIHDSGEHSIAQTDISEDAGTTMTGKEPAEAAYPDGEAEAGASTLADYQESGPVEQADSPEDQAAVQAAIQQASARQEELQLNHFILERQLRRAFDQRGSSSSHAKDNVHLAAQATRFTSLLSAFQARAAEKAAVAQAHATQMSNFTPLIERKEEAIGKLKAELKSMIEAAGQGAISSKTGHLLSSKILLANMAGMEEKQEELRAAQLSFLHIQAWLKAIQARVTAQESFSGGLGLMDLEQLQLEKAGLLIKLAGRDHEMAKFLSKRREVVQILAHVKSKLWQQRNVHKAVEAEVAAATTILNQHRAVAAAAKLAAQQAAEKAAREREKDTNMHDSRVVEHYQTQLLHREHLQQKMLEVSGRMSRTLMSISPNNIEYITPDMMPDEQETMEKPIFSATAVESELLST